jgi:hypothetical protein
MIDESGGDTIVMLTINDSKLAQPVLERLVSAAAAQANLPVDRVINALTVVDALVSATDRVFEASHPRDMVVAIGDRQISIAVEGLFDGQAESLRNAAVLPDVGDVFARTTSAVEIRENGPAKALVVSLE